MFSVAPVTPRLWWHDIYVKYMQQNLCTMCKKIILILYLCANVANFALFAGALCERCRICVVPCAFMEFSGLTPSLLVMGADSVNFA